MKYKVGYTLIELLVVIGIVTIVGSGIMFSYRVYSDNLALSEAAQEVSEAIRQAQTYGISGKEVVKGNGDFTKAYGISFDLNDPFSYYLFVDIDGNKIYNTSSLCSPNTVECIEKNSLKSGIRIISICGHDQFGIFSCPAFGAKKATIVFKRPSPDAILTTISQGGSVLPQVYKDIQISFQTSGGKTSKITVSTVGQVVIN